jgi:ubiquinone/menaquinone biosynthesis C-methylase UbiE
MDQAGSIRRQFGENARRYAESSYHTQSPDLAALLALAAPRGDERVLDVGTGTGHTALAFAARVAEVVGLDLTEAMLAEARRLAAAQGAANARFVLGDAMALDFPDRSFDLVTCRVCAHHFADPGRAVAEAARVLRPGGRLLVVDFAPHEQEFLREQFAHRRLGFAPDTVMQWITASGLDPVMHKSLAPEPGSEGKIAVSLWLARDTRALMATPLRREVA